MAVAVIGYAIQIDHRVYEGWRDGSPFTLAEAWRETYGVGHAAILRPDGTLMLRNAGNVSTRVEVGELGRWQRTRARHLRRGSTMCVDSVETHRLFRPSPRRVLP